MAARARTVFVAAGLLGAIGVGSMPGAGGTAPTEQRSAEAASAIPVPFRVGERLTYAVNFGNLQIGTAQMSVLGVEDVRGRPSYHVLFTIEGGMPLLRVQDRYESWIDTATLASRRHVQEIREGGYRRSTRYEIYPEQRKYREDDEDSLRASVANPLDEGSFVYFIRTVHVPVGQTREFHQYFKPDRNPVIIRALRRDTVEVPSGRYPTVVVRPSIRARGIFAEDGEAQLWFSDDPRRILVKMNTKFAGIALSLALTDFRAGAG
jgi:hypothetical protein